MKIILIFFILLCYFPDYSFAQLGKAGSGKQKAEIITIVADTWCPYNCNPKSPHNGFMIELVRQALAKHNIGVIYKTMAWSEAISETRKGKYSAIVGAAINDAPDFIYPTIEQGFMQNYFYVKKGNEWRYKGIKSLSNIVLGLISDYSYNKEMDAYIKKYRLDSKRIEMMTGDDALGINLNKILRGRLDGTLDAKYVVEYYISLNNMQNRFDEAGSLPVSDNDKLYIAFSPINKVLAQKYADIITDETNKMRASGELAKILDVYGLKDWK